MQSAQMHITAVANLLNQVSYEWRLWIRLILRPSSAIDNPNALAIRAASNLPVFLFRNSFRANTLTLVLHGCSATGWTWDIGITSSSFVQPHMRKVLPLQELLHIHPGGPSKVPTQFYWQAALNEFQNTVDSV